MSEQPGSERVRAEESGAVSLGDLSMQGTLVSGRDTTINYYGRDQAGDRIHARVASRERGQKLAGIANRRVDAMNPGEIASPAQITDLEVEVTVRRSTGRRRRLLGPRRRLKREGSLLTELRSSDEQSILLEGEAGSGKSVALKTLAGQINDDAMQDGGTVALYVNLKTLERGRRPIDQALIRDHVRRTVEGHANEPLRALVAAEFQPRLETNGWLFLLDSFDEIPEVLAATGVDAAIKAYSRALHEFALAVAPCRVVVASRLFNAPDVDRWASFRIAPLSEKRRRAFIADSGLTDHRQQTLLRNLGQASLEMVNRSRNPLFLGLLCEHAKADLQFPKTPHEVIDKAIVRRLERVTDPRNDAGRGFTVEELSRTAARIAYAMTAARTGLEPRIGELYRVLPHYGVEVDDRLVAALDALESAELARTDETRNTFCFFHRRFQEYFATVHVIQAGPPGGVNLLTDGQWRETAVTLCQLGSGDLGQLLAHAEVVLRSGIESAHAVDASAAVDAIGAAREPPAALGREFIWPAQSLHVLGVLQSGFGDGPDRLPTEIRELIGRLLATAWRDGEDDDRRTVLELVGTAADDVRIELLRAAFYSSSRWLSEVAYSQVARLRSLPPELSAEVRRMIVGMAGNGRLSSEFVTVDAEIARVDDRSLRATLRMIRWVPVVDGVAHLAFIAFVAAAIVFGDAKLNAPLALTGFTFLALLSYLGWRGIATVAAQLRRRAGPVAGNVGEIHSPPTSAAVGFMGRTYVLLGCFSLTGAALPGLALPVLYLLTWPIAALTAAIRGSFVAPPLWPLAHVSVAQAVRGSISRRQLATAVGCAIALLAFCTASAWAVSEVHAPPAIGDIVVLVICGAVLAGLVAATRPFLLDLRWYHDWTKDPRAVVRHVELLTYLEEQRTARGLLRIIRTIRDDHLLEPGAKSEQTLRELLGLTRINPKEVATLVEQRQFESALIWDWMSSLRTKKLKLITTTGVDLRDELGPTLADVRNRRQSTRRSPRRQPAGSTQ